ncbi:hypothetical protein ACLOJK_006626 [Asimina triloba]
MMAKREEEMEEIRSKSMEDINEEIIDLKGELFMLRLQKSSRGQEKEIADGINKRLSRKLDKKWLFTV